MKRESAPPTISRREFNTIAYLQGKNAQVTTKAWHALQFAESFFWDDDTSAYGKRKSLTSTSERVQIEQVMQTIRHVEAGEIEMPYGFGTAVWGIMTTINNAKLPASDPAYLIPWVDWIHPQFRSRDIARRSHAAERLQIAYTQLGELALNPPVNTSY